MFSSLVNNKNKKISACKFHNFTYFNYVKTVSCVYFYVGLAECGVYLEYRERPDVSASLYCMWLVDLRL